jgi:predicted N-formylglutamate amidohydrolase
VTQSDEFLTADEAPAFTLHEGESSSAFVIACDHASAAIPLSLGNLGVPAAERFTHIAWDIGVAGLARKLAQILGADVVLQNYSRLVIDCNRPLEAFDSIVESTAGVAVPGNVGLNLRQRELRIEHVFRPYHACIEGLLERRRVAGRHTVFVALHSFTPNFCGVSRPWHVGVLFQRDPRLAVQLLEQLRRHPELVVGENEPYRVTDNTDYSVINYGERAGRLHVEIEVRQDLISDDDGQARWAQLLSSALSEASLRASG